MAGDAAPDDRALAAALATGQPSALAGVYRAYADRLYSYAVTRTQDPDAAADAVADTFLLARDRIDQLREPDKLRPWLYAICRNECTRHHRQRARVANVEAAGQMSDPTIDLDRGLAAQDAAALVEDVLPALNSSDREVLELALRHELASDEIGAALGMSTNVASARLSRARRQFERALGALVLFKVGGRHCDDLKAIIDGAEFTGLTRKRIARHVDSCDTCGHRKAALVADLSSSYAWPLQTAPEQLAARVLGATSAEVAAAGAGAPAFDAGWPGVGRSGPTASRVSRAIAVVVTAAAGVVVLLGLGAVALGNPPARTTPPPPSPLAAVSPRATTSSAALPVPTQPSAPATPAGPVQDDQRAGAPARAGDPTPQGTVPAAETPVDTASADSPPADAPIVEGTDPSPSTPAEVPADTPITAVVEPTTPPWNTGADPQQPPVAPDPSLAYSPPPQLYLDNRLRPVDPAPQATSVYIAPVPR